MYLRASVDKDGLKRCWHGEPLWVDNAVVTFVEVPDNKEGRD